MFRMHYMVFILALLVRFNVCGGVCLLLKDFGEYQESYYSVQTTEGEQISQLIAGYIDIILKKVSVLSFF